MMQRAADFRPVVVCDESIIIQSSTVDIFQLAFLLSSIHYLTQSSLLHLEEGLYRAHLHCIVSTQGTSEVICPPVHHTVVLLCCHVPPNNVLLFSILAVFHRSCKRQIRTYLCPTSFSSRHIVCLTFCRLMCFI